MTRQGLSAAIGNTPLIRLAGPSEITGCEIFGKAEFMNPGGSVKDRAALGIVSDAERRGLLRSGGVIVEGTAGNTGISLAMIGAERGYRTIIAMPKTQSQEKKDLLRLLGADLRLTEAVPYKNPENYVRVSERLAQEAAMSEAGGAIWANQFDNTANREAHRTTTGPEIWEQTEGRLDAFVCAVGSGGTIGGIGLALKERNPSVKIVLSDPMGSALHNFYVNGELKAEGSSITEGIGQGRVTANLEGIEIDGSQQVTDAEALPVLYGLIRNEGLFLGGSSAINVTGAIKLAQDMGPGHTIVTILCDSGTRYMSKLFNPEFMRDHNLPFLI